MRIGLIADIHGNSFALRHVLEHLEHQSIDMILCLGDVAVLGPDPVGSIGLIREYARTTVLGNVDRWLVNRLDDEELHETKTSELRELAAWSLHEIPKDELNWIDALPTIEPVLLAPGETLLAFHGSPRSNDEVIAAVTPDQAIGDMFQGVETRVAVSGHTHIPMLRRFGQAVLINPGSVGLPGVGPGSPDLPVNQDVGWAEYAVLTIEGGFRSVAFERVSLPLTEMLDWARATEMPAFAWWVSKWKTPL